jgi:hypothetical protein
VLLRQVWKVQLQRAVKAQQGPQLKAMLLAQPPLQVVMQQLLQSLQVPQATELLPVQVAHEGGAVPVLLLMPALAVYAVSLLAQAVTCLVLGLEIAAVAGRALRAAGEVTIGAAALLPNIVVVAQLAATRLIAAAAAASAVEAADAQRGLAPERVAVSYLIVAAATVAPAVLFRSVP